MTDLEKQDPVETARLTTGEESNECYTKDELLSKKRGSQIRAPINRLNSEKFQNFHFCD